MIRDQRFVPVWQMKPEDKRERARLIRKDAAGRGIDVARTLRGIADELDELADAQEREGKVPGPDGSEPTNYLQTPSARTQSSA